MDFCVYYGGREDPWHHDDGECDEEKVVWLDSVGTGLDQKLFPFSLLFLVLLVFVPLSPIHPECSSCPSSSWTITDSHQIHLPLTVTSVSPLFSNPKVPALIPVACPLLPSDCGGPATHAHPILEPAFLFLLLFLCLTAGESILTYDQGGHI